jgi:hypothetical protein
MAWTDEKRAEVVAQYEGADPTPETSMEIVKEIADDVGESPNGVRMILTKAGVYVKKDTTSKTTSGSTGKRVSKVAAHAKLFAEITSAGQEPDMEIIGKMTGKAAEYLSDVISKIRQTSEYEL